MPITCIWDNPEKSVLRHIYQGSWEWKDFYQSIAEADAMMDTVDHKVHVIVDVRKSKIMPSDTLTHIGHLRGRTAHANRGQTVLVGGNMFLQRLYTLFSKIYPEMVMRFLLVSSIEEAYSVFDVQSSQSSSEPPKPDA